MQVIKHTNECRWSNICLGNIGNIWEINQVKQVVRLSKTSMYSPPKSLQNNWNSRGYDSPGAIATMTRMDTLKWGSISNRNLIWVITIYLRSWHNEMNARAHDAYTTRNLEILVIVKVK